MSEIAKKSEHERVELLLPWFVNESVDDTERSTIQRHLDECEACRAAVLELQVLHSAVRQSRATPIVPEPNVSKLLESVESESQLPRRQRRRWLAAASIGAMVVALLGYLVGSENMPSRYETATSADSTEKMDYVFEIRFQDGLSESDRQQIVQDLDATVVTLRKSGARLIIQLPAGTLQEIETFTQNTTLVPGITAVHVVAVQLPLRRVP